MERRDKAKQYETPDVDSSIPLEASDDVRQRQENRYHKSTTLLACDPD